MPVTWVAWTEANMTTLQKMAKQGATAAEIGAEVGKSRNAVISRARRSGITLHRVMNGWEPKPIEFVSTPVNTGPVTINGVPFTGDVVPGEFVKEPGVSFFEVTLCQCRWIEGEVNHRHTKFCGAQVLTGKSWCAEHSKRVFARNRGEGWR
jgi:GcrA cell cycle regulator